MIYVYAVTASEQPLPAARGLDEGALHAVDGGGVRAVCSLVSSRPSVDPDTLWAHEAVVEATLERGGTLPVRFATCCRDDEEVRELLARHGDRLGQGLADVRGQVEVGLRVLWEAAPPPAPEETGARAAATGRDYLRARSAQGRAEREWREEGSGRAEQLHSLLAAQASAATHQVLPNPRTLMVAAYLIAPECIARFRDTVAELADEHPDLTLVPTGPWPPYSFAPSLEAQEPHSVP